MKKPKNPTPAGNTATGGGTSAKPWPASPKTAIPAADDEQVRQVAEKTFAIYQLKLVRYTQVGKTVKVVMESPALSDGQLIVYAPLE